MFAIKPTSLRAQLAPPQTEDRKLPPLSKFIVSAASASLATLASEIKSFSVNAADKASALTSLSILFGYMQEIGYNQDLKKYILSKKDIALYQPPDSTKITTLRQKIEAKNLGITRNQSERIFDLPVEQKQLFFAHLSEVGIEGIEENILQRLSKIQTTTGSFTPTSYQRKAPAQVLEVHADASGCAEDGVAAGVLGLLSPP